MTFSTDVTYYRKARDGKAFIVSEAFSIDSGNSKNIHLKNPADTGTSLIITSLEIQSNGPYKSVVHDLFDSQPSGGTNVEIENVLMDSAGSTTNNGVASANHNVTFSSTSQHALGVGGGGHGGNAGGFSSNHPAIVMQPDREIVVEVENTDGATLDYAVSIVYVEVPVNDK